MKNIISLLLALGAFALVSCGGGSSTDTTNKTTQTPASTVVQIVGTAATGAALTFANVEITSTDGSSPCVETDIKTDGLGAYKCTMKVGKTAPFFIVVTDPAGNTAPLVSIATVTPTAGTPLTVNATPLTTAIVGQLNGGDALSVVSDKTKYSADKLNTIKANVLAQIKAILTSIGAPTDYDPFTTSITAATAGQIGNTADQVLDVIKIARTSDMKLAFSTIADPTPIQMATDTAQGSSVAAPPASIGDLSKGTFALAQAFNTCYALTTSKRATVSNGLIVDRAPECKNLITSLDNPKGAPEFLHNGYGSNDANSNLLTNDSMTGAKFSVPEIMSYYPKKDSNSRDKAVINIRFIDNKGIAGNRIAFMQNFENSSSTAFPSNWWITGNQSKYDVGVIPEIRKVKDWLYANSDTYQSGFHFEIYADSSAPLSSTFNNVLVTGRGLPTTGLWMVRSVSGYTGSFVVARSRASIPQPLSALVQTCNDCDNFWMSHTAGITGTSASTLKSNDDWYTWAKKSEGAYDGTVESSRPIKGDIYTFRLYKDQSLVATETRALLDDVTSATNMQYLPWHISGPNTAAAFDIANTALNGLQTSVLLDWINNPNAEPIFKYWFSKTDGNGDTSTPIKLGETSVLATPGGINTRFTSLTGKLSYSVPPLDGYRNVGFVYRTTNGTKKVMVNYYFP